MAITRRWGYAGGMRRLTAVLTVTLMAAAGIAIFHSGSAGQSSASGGTLTGYGTITPGDCASWQSTTQVKDSGGACGGGSLPSGTEGAALVNTNGTTGYATGSGLNFGGGASPVLATGTFTNAGTFTGAAQQEYVQDLINGCNPSTEYFANHGNYAVDGITGCVSSPSGANQQVNAVAGYASTLTNSAVGGYFQARNLANNTFAEGVNAVVQDVAGLTTGVNMLANDANVYPLNGPSTYTSIAGYNLAFAAPAGFYSTGNGFVCSLFGGFTGYLNSCFYTSDGASNYGVYLGVGGGGGSTSVASQSVAMAYLDSGGTRHQILSLSGANGVWSTTGTGIQQYEQAAPGGTSPYDLFWADSTAHRWKMINGAGVGTATTVAGFSDNLSAFAGYASVANSTNSAPATLTDAATVTWAIGSAFQANSSLTFTVHSGSRTLNITGPVTGGTYILRLVQDATGGEGLTLGTGCTWKVSGGGAGAVTPSTGANAIDILTFYYDGTNCYANFNTNFS